MNYCSQRVGNSTVGNYRRIDLSLLPCYFGHKFTTRSALRVGFSVSQFLFLLSKHKNYPNYFKILAFLWGVVFCGPATGLY